MPTPAVVQQFNMDPVKSSPISNPPSSNITNIPAEAYQTYMKIVDPEGIYLNKLSRLLYNSYLVDSNIEDPNSPVPGKKLVRIGGVNQKTLVNWEGYNTITNNFLLLASEVISTTEFDTSELDLRRICVNGVWGIIFQLVRNWEDWDFNDETEIITLGNALWFNIYGVSRRSTGGGKMLGFLTNLFKYIGNRNHPEDDRNQVKFWGNKNATT